MSRKTTVVKHIEQLISLISSPLNLCDTCKGCKIKEDVDNLRKEAWANHRQSFQFVMYKCNSYKEDAETEMRVNGHLEDKDE